MVRKYNPQHICDISERNNEKRQATKKFLANRIKYKYLRHKRVYRPLDIATDVKFKLGADINYQQAWRIKEEALKMIRGTSEESYKTLPSLLYMIQQTNLGSVISLVKKEDNKFKYLFIAMVACIEGWQHFRPVLVTDGMFLKTCYNGILISSCAYDATST